MSQQASFFSITYVPKKNDVQFNIPIRQWLSPHLIGGEDEDIPSGYGTAGFLTSGWRREGNLIADAKRKTLELAVLFLNGCQFSTLPIRGVRSFEI